LLTNKKQIKVKLGSCLMVPSCERCVKVEEECRQKGQGLGCKRCAQWKVGYSAVGLKRKGAEKKAEQRVTEDAEGELVVPLELSDGVMEQVEAMAKELRKISGGIWALVVGVGKLTEAVEGMGKKEVVKVDKEMETEKV
jgi:NAD(P)-dependent dehydrogenase (short-subunit alcohol dehydrogenase family)